MTKAKKIDKRQSIEDVLVADEVILWQGKPQASLFEYISKKPIFMTDNSIKGGLTFGLSRAAGFTIATLVLALIATVFFRSPLAESTQMTASFVSILFIIVIPLYIFLVAFGSGISLVIIRAIQNVVFGIIEKPFIRYGVTNQRIIVIASRWVYDFVFHFEVHGVIITDGQYGITVTWLSGEDDLPDIQPFVGISDFDLSHILDIVREQSRLNVTVDDQRN